MCSDNRGMFCLFFHFGFVFLSFRVQRMEWHVLSVFFIALFCATWGISFLPPLFFFFILAGCLLSHPLMQMANGSFACCVFIGELWCITKLKLWPLEQVLVQKYDYPPKQAKALKDFLVLPLALDPAVWLSMKALAEHLWLWYGWCCATLPYCEPFLSSIWFDACSSHQYGRIIRWREHGYGCVTQYQCYCFCCFFVTSPPPLSTHPWVLGTQDTYLHAIQDLSCHTSVVGHCWIFSYQHS